VTDGPEPSTADQSVMTIWNRVSFKKSREKFLSASNVHRRVVRQRLERHLELVAWVRSRRTTQSAVSQCGFDDLSVPNCSL